MNQTIYLAGKVNGAKHALARRVPGPEYVFSDGGDHSEHAIGYVQCNWEDCRPGGELRGAVEERAHPLLEACDFLVAFLDRPDCFGTIAEIAFVSGLGKTCFVIVLDPVDTMQESGNDGSMFDAYWFVNCLPGVLIWPVTTFDEAAGALNAIVTLQSAETPLMSELKFGRRFRRFARWCEGKGAPLPLIRSFRRFLREAAGLSNDQILSAAGLADCAHYSIRRSEREDVSMTEIETHWRQLSALLNELNLPQLLGAHLPSHRRYLANRLEFLVWQIDRLFDERRERDHT